jgi:hypothetical protein
VDKHLCRANAAKQKKLRDKRVLLAKVYFNNRSAFVSCLLEISQDRLSWMLFRIIAWGNAPLSPPLPREVIAPPDGFSTRNQMREGRIYITCKNIFATY